MDLVRLLDLASHGADTFIGTGPQYHWGGLYGGQIVAQTARAAANTIDGLGGPDGFAINSLRAYFIRPGDASQPIQFDVERLRTGRGFATRRVLARQADGAILNLEASFQRPQDGPDIDSSPMPVVPGPDDVATSNWTPLFERKPLMQAQMPDDGRRGAHREMYWMRSNAALGDDQVNHCCAAAYMSDDLPCDAVARAHPGGGGDLPTDHPQWFAEFKKSWFSASLDHAMWFHRPMRADTWQLFDCSCVTYAGGRGLTVGNVYALDGTHVCTFTQEAVVRPVRA